MPVAVHSSEGLGSSAWCRARLLPGERGLELRPLKRQCDERQATAPNLPLLADAHAPEQPAADLELRATAVTAGRRRGQMRERWSGQLAAHGLKTPLPAKRPATDANAPVPWARQQSETAPLPTRTANAPNKQGIRYSAATAAPTAPASTLSAATCCLTFELRGWRREGAWPARRMMTVSASRAKCLAGGSPHERRVRPHRDTEHDPCTPRQTALLLR